MMCPPSLSPSLVQTLNHHFITFLICASLLNEKKISTSSRSANHWNVFSLTETYIRNYQNAAEEQESWRAHAFMSNAFWSVISKSTSVKRLSSSHNAWRCDKHVEVNWNVTTPLCNIPPHYCLFQYHCKLSAEWLSCCHGLRWSAFKKP